MTTTSTTPDPIARPDHPTPPRPPRDDAPTSPPPRPRTHSVAIGVGVGAAAAGAVLLTAHLLRRRRDDDDDDRPANARGPAIALGSLGAERAVALMDRAIDQYLDRARVSRRGPSVRNADSRDSEHDADPRACDGSAAHSYRGSAQVDTLDGPRAPLAWRLWWTGRAWRVALELHGDTHEVLLTQLYETLSARLSRASTLAVRNQIAHQAATRPKPPPPTIDV